jgi:hypothetical protein
MAEKEYSSLISSSIVSNMDINEQDKKDISKIFTFIRNKLNAKEKELLELQRAESWLLAPDSKQIDSLIDLISSLHLSTQDGSFIFASKSNSNDSSSSTCISSTGVETIKTLPSKFWLSQSNSTEQENQYRLPMVTQLLSLPANAYIASSKISINDQPSNHLPMVNQLLSMPISAFTSLPINTNEEPSNRLPMVSQLLSMPINAFTSSSSSNNQTIPIQTEEKKETVTKVSSTNRPPKSILESELMYSKDYWLKKSSPSENNFVKIDVDAYIEQSTDKMRRLHLEYLEAIEKLKTPTDPIEPSQMIKTMYPQMLERINPNKSSSKDTTSSTSTVKK